MKERRQRIFEIVRQRGSVTVEQLTREVYASEATVRRDLQCLEQQGLLMRVWGGAVRTDHIHRDPPVLLRSKTNISAKKKIARYASGLLRNNMSIFLPSGTTVAELAALLYSFENLTVITTSLDVLETLRNHSSIKLITPGGELHEHYDFAGPLAGEIIDRFHADLLFFSCSGLTAAGFTSTDAARLDVICRMHRNSTKTVLLADRSKVGKTFTYNGFGWDSIDYVIMEAQPDDPALVQALGKKLFTGKPE